MKTPNKLLLISLIYSLLGCLYVQAQESQDSELYLAIQSKDHTMFEMGYNQCNIEIIADILPEVFEFYHDKDGYTDSKDSFLKLLKKNVCSTGVNLTKRILNKESVEVYPLFNEGNIYAALHTGIHRFGNVTAKFTNLWRLENADWQPSRIFSYDHKVKQPAKITDIEFIELSHQEMLRYIGKYDFSNGFVLEIVVDNSKIYGVAQGQKVKLRPYGNHKFLDHNQKMKLDFIESNNGVIDGLIIHGMNNNKIAKKLK